MQNLQELKNLENRLLEQLEAILTNLSAIRKTKALLEGRNELLSQPQEKTTNALVAREKSITPKEEYAPILNAIADYLNSIGNKPTFVRDIKKFVESKGLVLHGANPGATLGAILRGDKRFVLVDKKERLWALKA